MDFGAHLPLMDFGGNPYTFAHLATYTRTAARLGFSALAVNDHLVFAVPWLDGPTALAAMIEHSGDMTLATTVSLPVVRGPVPLAKTLAAIDRLSGGRLVVAVGPGSSEQDYASVGVDFDERWPRLDESIRVLRALVAPRWSTLRRALLLQRGDRPRAASDAAGGPADLGGQLGFRCRAPSRRASGRRLVGVGVQHDTVRVSVRPGRVCEINSRHTARIPTPIPMRSRRCGSTSPTTASEAERVMRERVLPTIHRPEEVLRDRLPIGPAELFAEKLGAFAEAGVQRVFVWPVADEARQLELFRETVQPLLGASS